MAYQMYQIFIGRLLRMNFIKAFSLIYREIEEIDKWKSRIRNSFEPDDEELDQLERIFLKLRLKVQNAEFLSKELETRILKIKTEKLRQRTRGSD